MRTFVRAYLRAWVRTHSYARPVVYFTYAQRQHQRTDTMMQIRNRSPFTLPHFIQGLLGFLRFYIRIASLLSPQPNEIMIACDVTRDVIIDDVCVASERYANAQGLATADGSMMTKVRRGCALLSGINISSTY